MSMTVEIKVNNDPVLGLSITRISPLANNPHPDTMCLYEVHGARGTGSWQIAHRYGDSPETLAQKAMRAAPLHAGSPPVGPQPAVDVIDVLAAAARREFYSVGVPVPPNRWRRVAQAVRDADEPYRSPTPDAYAAAVRALEKHREAERVAGARLVQLALLARDMLKQIEVFESQVDHATWAQHSETVEELRDQFAEALCDGGHAEDEPHTNFLPEEYR